MSLVLALIVSILYPVLIFKLFGLVQTKLSLRLYWAIVPLCLVISFISPYLYYYIYSPGIVFSIKAIISYSVKSGFVIFLVVPSLLSGIVCTLMGYFRGT